MGESPGGLAGYLVAWLVADEVQVMQVAVHPDSRRRGVAQCLMGAVLGTRCEESPLHKMIASQPRAMPAGHT